MDRVPRSLHSLFEPEGTRDQPHLDHLRERKRKLEEAFASGDLSLSEDAPMIIQEAKHRRKSSNQGLLSDAEKKANHIASEQKRRANIRKGYDMLASVLPSLDRPTIVDSRVSADEMGGENRSAAYSEIAVLLEGMLSRTSVCYFYSRLFLHFYPLSNPDHPARIPDTDSTAAEHLQRRLQEHHRLLAHKNRLQHQILAHYEAS